MTLTHTRFSIWCGFYYVLYQHVSIHRGIMAGDLTLKERKCKNYINKPKTCIFLTITK